MKELVSKITSACAEFAENAEKSVEGNKSAGVRARVKSIEIEKLLKEYRKVSVKS